MRTGILLLACLIALGLPQAAPGMDPSTAANEAVKIAEARKANAALMHQYSWNSRVEIVVNAQVKDTRIEQLSYNPFGQLQRITLNDQGGTLHTLPTPIGFLRRGIAEVKKEEMQEYLHGLRGLLEQYTLPTTGKILDFLMAASPSLSDAQGLIKLSGKNVVQPGDNLNMWFNPWTKHLQHIQVNTTFQGNSVQLTATFATLPGSGLNYASFAEATVPDKQLSVQVQNYNYVRSY